MIAALLLGGVVPGRRKKGSQEQIFLEKFFKHGLKWISRLSGTFQEVIRKRPLGRVVVKHQFSRGEGTYRQINQGLTPFTLMMYQGAQGNLRI